MLKLLDFYLSFGKMIFLLFLGIFMGPTQAITTSSQIIVEESKVSSTGAEDVKGLAKDVLTKYPNPSTVVKLDSTLIIKQMWLHSEWAPECQFSRFIRQYFPDRNALDPAHKHPNIALIQSTFEQVRGKFSLWQAPREEGRWKKIETPSLALEWVKDNVEVLFPAKERFSVVELKGIVLWDDKSGKKRYKLYEGNHRISAWLAAQTPSSVPAIIFIGKPKKAPAKSVA